MTHHHSWQIHKSLTNTQDPDPPKPSKQPVPTQAEPDISTDSLQGDILTVEDLQIKYVPLLDSIEYELLFSL
jgi:hypothetical protein